jgi:hypothetical protein
MYQGGGVYVSWISVLWIVSAEINYIAQKRVKRATMEAEYTDRQYWGRDEKNAYLEKSQDFGIMMMMMSEHLIKLLSSDI